MNFKIYSIVGFKKNEKLPHSKWFGAFFFQHNIEKFQTLKSKFPLNRSSYCAIQLGKRVKVFLNPRIVRTQNAVGLFYPQIYLGN